MDQPEDLRFADILTTAAAIADYLAAGTVTARHLIAAVAVLRAEKSYEDLGRGRVPLGHRPPGGAPVSPSVRALVQQWFHALGDNPDATLPPAELERFLAALSRIDEATGA